MIVDVRFSDVYFKQTQCQMQSNIDDFGVNLDTIVANNPQFYIENLAEDPQRLGFNALKTLNQGLFVRFNWGGYFIPG